MCHLHTSLCGSGPTEAALSTHTSVCAHQHLQEVPTPQGMFYCLWHGHVHNTLAVTEISIACPLNDAGTTDLVASLAVPAHADPVAKADTPSCHANDGSAEPIAIEVTLVPPSHNAQFEPLLRLHLWHQHLSHVLGSRIEATTPHMLRLPDCCNSKFCGVLCLCQAQQGSHQMYTRHPTCHCQTSPHGQDFTILFTDSRRFEARWSGLPTAMW